ncbi:MAG: glycosyltransferase [Candidatus Mariimomonas ferrooxydans]
MDRKLTVPNSLKAKILRMIDRHSCMIADVVLLDTNEHIEYFVREFGLPREKFIRVFVGEDDSIFKHETTLSNIPKNNPIKVLFFGTYIPLHGIDYILKAAEILKDNNNITFSMIGDGPLLENTLSISNSMKLKNIQFITRWINYDKLPEYIREADICLGIFGDTEKAKRVIPCKVYDCIALGKPLITGDSPAVRELLTDGEDVIFCEMANPEDLAKSILTLQNDYNLRKKIGENAYNTYTSFASPKVIGENLVNNLKPLISREYKG